MSHPDGESLADTLDFIRTISPDDPMHPGDDASFYYDNGREALGLIRRSMAAAGKPDAREILDLPCGYGRVLRTLRAAFPQARITACDIDARAVEFCAQTFDASPVVSRRNPDEIDLGRRFDLIWCGSLLTHLDRERYHGFLALFERALSPGGLLVFSTNGRRVIQIMQTGLKYRAELERLDGLPPNPTPELWDAYVAANWYKLPPGMSESVLHDYAEDGFGYSAYGWTDDFGLTVSSPAWVCRALERVPSLRLAGYTERGWADAQDVVACVREA